jgi:uncharacterized membrane protein
MPVDVAVERVIHAPVAQVSAFAGDPSNAPAWYANIKSIRWQTAPPLHVGSRMTFTARFLGRTLVYTYEVVALEPGRRLVMQTHEGPFPMQTTYEWAPAGRDATRMVLRNRGEPSGFAKVTAPLMAAAMRRAMANDLRRLASILEAPPA